MQQIASLQLQLFWRYYTLNYSITFFQIISLCITGGFFQSQSHYAITFREFKCTSQNQYFYTQFLCIHLVHCYWPSHTYIYAKYIFNITVNIGEEISSRDSPNSHIFPPPKFSYLAEFTILVSILTGLVNTTSTEQ